MQKVSQLPYQRVSMEAFAQEIQGIITQVKEASSAQAVMAARDQCNQLVVRWQTAEALSYMRYSINTADPFYLAEKDYYDEVGPQAQNYLLEYTKAMLAKMCIRDSRCVVTGFSAEPPILLLCPYVAPFPKFCNCFSIAWETQKCVAIATEF